MTTELQSKEQNKPSFPQRLLDHPVTGLLISSLGLIPEDRFAYTALSGGYTVPKFQKIAEAYGIRAVTLSSYEELELYSEWFTDRKPCLFDIPLSEMSLLTPKKQV